MYNPHNKTIETTRLLLRPFLASDAPIVSELCNNYNIYKSTLSLPYPYSESDAVAWIERHEGNFSKDVMYQFAITDKVTQELYGGIGISNNQGHKHGELAYWIGEKYWGKGIASEAAKAMIEFAFNHKKYHKVYATHFASNPASGKVMLKAGMVQEGVLHQHVKKENKFEDLVYYGIINQ
ncbi:RimJ/RimL family protein N-acetyltransferase [Paenibacillus turicensis]|uniref:RimJ/RimL family protein N-acetyltransferase n=1 Tax=Paenibacillus turicensis TaxID=160487 RepID=A0ABS4FXJ1_9BACL|nr:GNAT family N-acetyltransferase [Paenibacillus turicensis]MBP1907290.1 RimJ/RimL family protein N-acetyltransferase [Paenibacillus turicensis]